MKAMQGSRGPFLALLVLIALAAVGGLAYLADRKLAQPPEAGKLKIVASFYPRGFFAERIGGDRATVTVITPAGAEPHDYEPTAQDVARIEESDLLLLNGVGLEAWGENVARDAKHVVTAGEGLGSQTLTEDGKPVADPHVWLDPKLAAKMVDTTLAGFIAADPADEAQFQINASALKQELAALDAAYAAGLKDCASRDVVTSHAAFGYLAAAYGLRQTSIAGLSPDAEPSPERLADLAAFASRDHVEVIFFENLVNPKLSETLAQEVGAKTMVLDPLEGLSADDVASGMDFLAVMRANLTNLRTALRCTP